MLYGTNPTDATGVSRSGFITWLRGLSQIVPVASLTARAQYQAAEGVGAASTANPLFVLRGDADDHVKVEVNWGIGWKGLLMGDTGWIAATKDAAWDTYSTLQSRRVGSTIMLTGLARPDSGTITASATTGLIATLPSGHRPTTTIYRPITQWVSGGTPELRADAVAEVKANGEIRVINGSSSAATGAHFGFSFTND